MRSSALIALLFLCFIGNVDGKLLDGFMNSLNTGIGHLKSFLDLQPNAFNDAREKFNNWKKVELDPLFWKDNKPTELGEGLKTLAEGIGSGLAKLMEGIKNGDAKTGMEGIFTVVAPIGGLFGPYGKVLHGFLSALSSLLGIPGKKLPTATDMTKTLLDEIGSEMLIEEVYGILREFQVLQYSIQDLREQFKESQSNSVKKEIGDQLDVLYGTNFLRGSALLPKMQINTKKFCPIKTLNLQNLVECANRLNLYSKMSSLRQFVFLELATVAKDVGQDSILENMQAVLRGTQDKDREFLHFVVNPMIDPEYRQLVYFLSQRELLYPSLFGYLFQLQMVSEVHGFTFYNKKAVICSKKELQSDCTEIDPDEYKTEGDAIKGWTTFKSIYLPLYLSAKLKVQGKEHVFYGPTSVNPEISGGSKINSLHVHYGKQYNAIKYPMVCSAKLAPTEVYKADSCFPIVNSIGGPEHELGINTNKAIFEVPSGFTLTFKGSKRKLVGPIYTMLCHSQQHNTVTVHKSEFSAGAMLHIANRKPFVEQYFGTYNILQIPLCDSNTGAHGTEKTLTFKTVTSLQGCNMEGKIKYIKVPRNVKVDGYSKEKFAGKKFGGYTGPLPWTAVDGAPWKSMKIYFTC